MIEDARRLLITGANGFVGKALCARLMLQGYEVRIARRSSSKITAPIGLAQEEIVIGPIDDRTDWSGGVAGVDVVIHLAARVHMMKDFALDPLAEFLQVNLYGTSNLAQQAARAGVKRFVYVSSIKVNGEYTKSFDTFNSSDVPQPQDYYAISKWQAEESLHSISQETGMEVVIVRPPLIYGPNVKANFAKLLRLIDRGVPLPLKNIQNSRSLIYVDNLVDALIRCATHPAAAGQTYLVSDGEDVSTPQLIHAIAVALHRQDRLFPVPISLMRNAAKLIGKSSAVNRLTQSLVIDSTKISKELDWYPPYTLAQGLQATADWYRQFIQPA